MPLALATAVMLALGVGAWLTLSIGRPVAALKRGMLDVADGNFSGPLPIDREFLPMESI